MGIFDAFTGGPVKDAAAQNAALYNQNFNRGLGYLDTGYNTSNDALHSAVGAYQPLTDLGHTFAGATGNYLDAIGANGPAGNTRAVSNFQAAPGYQYQLGQGLQAIDRGAASRGLLSSGNTLMAEQKYGSDLANQGYQQYVNNLGTTVNPALTATAGGAYGTAQGYTGLANLGQMDATNRVNLSNTTTSGQAGANMQAANAQMAGSGNLWNFALNAGRLASGFGAGGGF